MASTISSKYQELVSRSRLISGGRPNVYQLEPTKKESGALTRLTFGERNLNRPNKTILLVGERGTGKSTLIDVLFNHSMGVTWEDEVWFQLVEESSDQSESATSDVIVYQIFGYEGTAPANSLTIIDTPGFGDIEGIEHDAIISERLLDMIRVEDGVCSLDAVGLVVKSSVNRLSDRLSYTFNSVMSLFAKDMERNIVVLVTHSDGITPQNTLQALDAAKIKCARNEKNQPTHFLFNNQQKIERTEEDEKSLEHAWRISKRGMDQFTAFLDRTTPQELEETAEVLNERVCLAACIQNLQEQIHLTELKRQEIQQKQEAVRKHEEAMAQNENYEGFIDESNKDTEEIPGGRYKDSDSGSDPGSGSCLCLGGVMGSIMVGVMVGGILANSVGNSEGNVEVGAMVGAMVGAVGSAIGGIVTGVLDDKCPARDHVKDTWKSITKTRKEPNTDELMKEESLNHNIKKPLLDILRDEEKKLLEDKWRLLDDAYQHVVHLDQIALNVNSVSTCVHYDFLIEHMSEKGDQEKAQKLEGMKSRIDDQSKSAAAYAETSSTGLTKRRKAEPELQ
ncbi:uncharacterized protein LOC115383930 [Salarias fasciatus]|nr:uncharacterized protein LOC115383930 [Salarias fasciatus]